MRLPDELNGECRGQPFQSGAGFPRPRDKPGLFRCDGRGDAAESGAGFPRPRDNSAQLCVRVGAHQFGQLMGRGRDDAGEFSAGLPGETLDGSGDGYCSDDPA